MPQPKKPLRSRLDWLLVAIASGKYGRAVSTRTELLIDDYVKAGHGNFVITPSGPRCIGFGNDLTELDARGYVARRRQGFNVRQKGVPTWVFVYELTPLGERSVQSILAEKEQDAADA
jgi:hypothetical protein